MIPPFDAHAVFVQPWTDWFDTTVWIVVMGFLVTAACGLVGNYLVLRRLSLLGDAISHSLLPGIALAFLLAATRDTWAMFLGALGAGLVTALAIEGITKLSRVKADAALGIVFSALFALGVIMITAFADHIDLDADCVLYGEIAFVPLERPVELAGVTLGPLPVVRMALILALVVVALVLFYKELLVTSFDAGLAASLGLHPGRWHYALMAALSLVVVSSFTAVGAILVIAMLIFPAATASLFTVRLPARLVASVGLAALYAVGGFHLATWLDSAPAAAMVVVALVLFVLAWIASPHEGLIARWRRARRRPASSTEAIREPGWIGRGT